MRWARTAMFVFILPLTGVAQGNQRCTAEDALLALLREYEIAQRGDTNRGPDNPLREFPARFLAVARTHPGSPVECAALGWIIGHGPGGPHADGRPEVNATVEAAIEILSRDYVRDAAIGPVCTDLVYHIRSKAAEGLLRRVIGQNPGREARGLACLSLARCLGALSESGLQRRLNPATGGFLDRPLVKRLRDSDPEALHREAEAFLSRVVKQYADVEYHGERLGEIARRERSEFRDLAIGQKAPEITGEDLDGRPMKLSDYRGKVIVLNFSSHEYCGICRAYYPFERSLVERLKDRSSERVAAGRGLEPRRRRPGQDRGRGRRQVSFWAGAQARTGLGRRGEGSQVTWLHLGTPGADPGRGGRSAGRRTLFEASDPERGENRARSQSARSDAVHRAHPRRGG